LFAAGTPRHHRFVAPRLPSPEFGARPGEVVDGRYRVEEVIGRGGFGVVVRAVQLNLGRPVAIKLLRPELLATELIVKRFLREARLVQRLEHPNTVRLLDVGQTAEGVPFLVFELLTGRPLDRVIRLEGPLEAGRVARIAGQALKALVEAHERQVVHRDLKPANIYLCEYQSERDYVKVLDFGIGKALDASGPGFTVLTQAGKIVGTPNYLAPERLRGEASEAPSSDLYALGLIMAEMLAGRAVVSGPSFDAICAVHLAEAPLELPPAVVGSPLAPVIRRAVEKDPARRFTSAAEMLAALRPERAAAASALAPPRLSRRALIAVVALCVVIFAAAGTGVGLLAAWLARPPAPSWSSPERIEQRLRLDGWIFGREDSGALDARVSLFQVSNLYGQRGVVAVYSFPNPAQMAVAVQSWQVSPQVAAVQDGATALIVQLGSRYESEALLADLLAERLPIAPAPPPVPAPGPAAFPTPPPISDPQASSTEGWPWLTPDLIADRLRLDGWTIGSRESNERPLFRVWSFGVLRSSEAGSVMLYRYQDLQLAQIMEGNYGSASRIAVAREGTAFLFVSAGDRAVSERLLAFILAGRP
jgi:serine/threonine protein kinase